MNTLTKTGSIIGKAALAAMLAGCLSVPGLAGADVGDGNSGSSGAVAGGVSGGSGSTSGGSTGTGTTTPKMKTLAGDDATDTAAEIAKEAFAGDTSVDTVVICNVNSWQDAMAATGLAGAVNAPILLTDGETLSEGVSSTISWLNEKGNTITKAYIIGGTGSISEQVEKDVIGDSSIVTTRIAGNDAQETSYYCALELARVEKNNNCSTKGQYAIISNANNFQDAVSMSSFAYKYHTPIFLTNLNDSAEGRTLSSDCLVNLIGGNYENAKVFVLGGQGALTDANITAEIEDWSEAGRVVRIAGDNGYDTSNQVAKYLTENKDANGNYYMDKTAVTVACGATSTNGSDALAGAALAAKQNSVVLLTNANSSIENVSLQTVKGTDSEGVKAFVANNNKTLEQYYVLGGSYVCPVSGLKGSLISGHVHNYKESVQTQEKTIEKQEEVCVREEYTFTNGWDICNVCNIVCKARDKSGQISHKNDISHHLSEQMDKQNESMWNAKKNYIISKGKTKYSELNDKEKEECDQIELQAATFNSCHSFRSDVLPNWTETVPAQYETVTKEYVETTTTTTQICTGCGDSNYTKEVTTTSNTEQVHNS